MIRTTLIFAILLPVFVQAQTNLLNLPLPAGGLRYGSYAEIEPDWPATHGEGSVCFWGDDKHAAISISIDDNNAPDISFWQQMSADYGWKFTWFLIVYPGMWDIYNDQPGNNLSYNGTAETWKVLHDQGHEIGLHGSCTQMNSLDAFAYEEHMQLSKDHLESVISNNIVTYAYPCGEIGADGVFKTVCESMFIGARGTSGGSTSLFNGDYLQTKSMGASLIQDRMDKLEDNTRPLAYSSYRGWGTYLWHGLLGNTNKIAGAVEVFDYLEANEHKYWIKPFGEVARYAQERESSTLNVTSVTADQIQFTVTDAMTNAIFNTPLTVKFHVDGWGDAVAFQGGQEVEVELIDHSGATYALVQAVPDAGIITLAKDASALFTAEPASGWAPLTVTFSDISTISVTNRIWDFGDGTITNTTATNMVHTYTSAGSYDVELIVDGLDGLYTNAQPGLISVTDPVAPVALFSALPTSGTEPLLVTFTDTSSGDITNRIWNFGDGAALTTTATSVQHSYAAGIYTVILTVQGPAGNSNNTQVDLIDVAAPVPPTAIFSADSVAGSVPFSVTFTDSSTGSISNRDWDFGDGNSSSTTQTSIQHTYADAGVYDVQLIVSGLAGAATNLQAGLITATNPPPPANTISIKSDVADQSIGSDGAGGLATYWIGQGTLSCGDDNYSISKGDACGIMVFQLPDLEGQSIGAANLEVNWQGDYLNGGDDSLPKGIDLYGVRYASTSAVSTSDYGYKEVGTTNGTLIQNTLILQDTNRSMDNEVAATSDAGDLALAAWLAAQYSAGAQPGDYVFLRLHADSHSANHFLIASGNDSELAPVLTLGFGVDGPTDTDGDGIPDDWETQYYGGATNANASAPAANGVNTIKQAYIAGLNPTNPESFFNVSIDVPLVAWNSVSGRVYSVYGATNLVDGFQPVETNIFWPQSNWTTTVSGEESFYQLKVKLQD